LSEHGTGGSVIVVSAPSGAGKTTVVTRVLNELDGLRFSVSHTTRAPRPGEKDGVEYHFIEVAAFERLRDTGQLLEWALNYGHYYGTGVAELEGARRDGVDLLLDLDVKGAAQVRNKIADAVTVFVLPPSYADLERRLRGRGQDDEASIQRRLDVAREELSFYHAYDYAVINDDLNSCVDSMKTIIRAARFRVGRMGGRAHDILETFKSQ
jgi:guanylate kinase